MKRQLMLFAILFLGLYIQLTAHETPINKIPGDLALVSSKEELLKLMESSQGNPKYKVEDYFEMPKSSSPSSSLKVSFLTYEERNDKGIGKIKIKEVKTGEVMNALEEKIQVILAIRWANEDRLIYIMDILETKITICMP
jgi:hypothetical protein